MDPGHHPKEDQIMITLTWISQDGQGFMEHGVWAADCDRDIAESLVERAMLAQCGSDADRAAIRAGRMVWEAVRE
jgi:hypothetical protein